MNEAALLSAIIEYKMTDIEARAYKISLLYLEKSAKIFPEEVHYKMPKGDPRKSFVFKHCYKLLREHGSELLEEDIKLYVHAQLDILKHITAGQEHPRISPAILAGPKAWNRWLLWKKKYNKTKKFSGVSTAGQVISKDRVKEACDRLDKTKMFLSMMLNDLTRENLLNHLAGDFWLWVRWGKISYYYLLLSPIVQKWCDENKIDIGAKVGFDTTLYQTNDFVQSYFKKEFGYEFY